MSEESTVQCTKTPSHLRKFARKGFLSTIIYIPSIFYDLKAVFNDLSLNSPKNLEEIKIIKVLLFFSYLVRPELPENSITPARFSAYGTIRRLFSIDDMSNEIFYASNQDIPFGMILPPISVDKGLLDGLLFISDGYPYHLLEKSHFDPFQSLHFLYYLNKSSFHQKCIQKNYKFHQSITINSTKLEIANEYLQSMHPETLKALDITMDIAMDVPFIKSRTLCLQTTKTQK
jgi:hypothetical protein